MALAPPHPHDKLTHPTGLVACRQSGLNRCHSFLLARMTRQLAKHLKILSMIVMWGMNALLGDNTAWSLFSLLLSVLSFPVYDSFGVDPRADISLSCTPVSLSLTCSSCLPLSLSHLFSLTQNAQFSLFIFSTRHPLWCVCVCMCIHVCVADALYDILRQ